MVTRNQKYIDISDSPDVVKLVEEVAAAGKPKVLRRNGKDVATLTPAAKRAPSKAKRARRKTGVLSPDLLGKYASEEPSDASRKHEMLAEGYFRLHT